MPRQLFNTQKWQSLSRRLATGTATVSGFYDGAAGTLTRLAISVAAQGTTNWKSAMVPEFTKTADGGEISGALFHVVKHDPNSFVVIIERIDGGPSEPLTGDLALTWTRRGYTR